MERFVVGLPDDWSRERDRIQVVRYFGAATQPMTKRRPAADLADAPKSRPGTSTLTPREKEVARLLARRRTSKEIAKALGISHATARRHTEKVLAKLGLRSRNEVEECLMEREP
ncbi:MAG: helix-turn-helix transcriptional regulator [Gemmatimonadota bacterium]|nr:helix-turn-helix transcriptional regulator [Gemmatimonadota bacterium]